MYWAWEVLDLLSVTLLASSDVTCRHSESIHARAREREWVRFLSLQLLRHSLRKVFRLRGSVENWWTAFRRQQTRHTWEEDDDVTTQTQTQPRDARKTSGSDGWVTHAADTRDTYVIATSCVAATGQAFGEIALISDDARRNATIVAEEDSHLCVINRPLFKSTLEVGASLIASQSEHVISKKWWPSLTGEAKGGVCAEDWLRVTVRPFRAVARQDAEVVGD